MAGPVCLEQHFDRHVETGHLTVEVLIQRIVRVNRETRAITESGRRAASAYSNVVMKTYTVNKGAEVIGGKVGTNFLLLEEGDKVELNGTLHHANGTGLRIINANVEEHSLKKELCTTFKAIPHDVIFRKLRGASFKASLLSEPEVIEIVEIKEPKQSKSRTKK